MTRRLVMVATVAALIAAGCGASNGSGAATRKVLVDYKHDAFASSFLHYYPTNVIVHPGDTVHFQVTWTGEPHSVTMGTIIDKFFGYAPVVNKYSSKEDALAHGETQAFVDEVTKTLNKVPAMTSGSNTIYEPGARPCFVAKFDDVPVYTDDNDNNITGPSTVCPTHNKPQPAFTGTQALYNSGFIPFQGPSGNTFVVPIAKNATPGTYNYYCNYHWTDMHGTVKIVPKSTPIPSQAAVTRSARAQIDKDAKLGLTAVGKFNKGQYGGTKPPIAGVRLTDNPDDNSGLQVNEFYPKTFHAKVGQPVTWTVEGFDHTVSFNVPKYFPVFTIAKSGDVLLDSKSYEGVGWTVPPEPNQQTDQSPPPRVIDVGKWDGSGGFHSSGTMSDNETFTVTFTKPGTYPYACVVHPPMIGTLVVS